MSKNDTAVLSAAEDMSRQIRVIKMKACEIDGFIFEGVYVGPVDDEEKPHGRGEFLFDPSSFLCDVHVDVHNYYVGDFENGEWILGGLLYNDEKAWCRLTKDADGNYAFIDEVPDGAPARYPPELHRNRKKDFAYFLENAGDLLDGMGHQLICAVLNWLRARNAPDDLVEIFSVHLNVPLATDFIKKFLTGSGLENVIKHYLYADRKILRLRERYKYLEVEDAKIPDEMPARSPPELKRNRKKKFEDFWKYTMADPRCGGGFAVDLRDAIEHGRTEAVRSWLHARKAPDVLVEIFAQHRDVLFYRLVLAWDERLRVLHRKDLFFADITEGVYVGPVDAEGRLHGRGEFLLNPHPPPYYFDQYYVGDFMHGEWVVGGQLYAEGYDEEEDLRLIKEADGKFKIVDARRDEFLDECANPVYYCFQEYAVRQKIWDQAPVRDPVGALELNRLRRIVNGFRTAPPK